MENKINIDGFPSKKMVFGFTHRAGVYLFPVLEGGESYIVDPDELGKNLCLILNTLQDKIPGSPEEISAGFITSLPSLRSDLEADATLIAGNDPAAAGVDEVIMTYPGFYAIMVYRLAHRLKQLGVPMVPRMMTEYAHSLTGIDINPGAVIGSPFFIDHGTGIVIGETTVIGRGVKLYQGVTLGALSVSKSMTSMKRHPTIEDDVIIYAGSTILGGDTVIGRNSIIGGNVWLTHSVPPGSLVYQEHVVKVRGKEDKLL